MGGDAVVVVVVVVDDAAAAVDNVVDADHNIDQEGSCVVGDVAVEYDFHASVHWDTFAVVGDDIVAVVVAEYNMIADLPPKTSSFVHSQQRNWRHHPHSELVSVDIDPYCCHGQAYVADAVGCYDFDYSVD